MPAVHLRVTGVVQGVGFRWYVSQAARRLGLAGWVRNLDDGTVEIAASGEEQGMLDDFVGQVRRGPPAARVEAVLTLPAGELGDLPARFVVARREA